MSTAAVQFPHVPACSIVAATFARYNTASTLCNSNDNEDCVVSADWLHQNLRQPDVKVRKFVPFHENERKKNE